MRLPHPPWPLRSDGAGYVFMLTGLASLAPLSVDMFLPSMPALARGFGTPEATMQLAVTLFVVAFAPSQLVFGPLSDRFGRKPALLAGLVLYTLAALGCLFAPTVEAFIGARVLQGLAAGSGPAISRAMVRDVFEGSRAAQIFAHVTTAIALAPMLAPVAGGFLEGAFGWRSVFLVLLCLALLFMAFTLLAVAETNRTPDPDALRVRRWVDNHRVLLLDRAFMATTLLVSLSFSGQFIFISNSAFVLIDLLGVRPDVFGLCFAVVASALAVGAFTGGRLVRRLGLRRTMMLGISVGSASGVVLATFIFAGRLTIPTLIAPMFCYTMGFSIARPPAMATALTPYPRMAGLASAFIGFLQMLLGGLAAVVFGHLYDGTPRPMAAGIAGAGLLALSVFLLLFPRRDPAPEH